LDKTPEPAAMTAFDQTPCTAFEGPRRIASGPLAEVAVEVQRRARRGEAEPILIFSDTVGEQIDLDLRGSAKDMLARLAERSGQPSPASDTSKETVGETVRGPGRPKLGVVAREITLLPRHWEWLNHQPGGASVALRKLVDDARRAHAGKDRVRESQEAAYRFMSAMAGNLAGFEEASRALFAKNSARFRECVSEWPADIRDHAARLAGDVFAKTKEHADT
jgi:hypothetical protein